MPSQHDKTHFFFTFLGDVDVIHRNITKTAIPPIGMNLWTLDQMSHIRKTTRPRVTTTVTMLERERERETNSDACTPEIILMVGGCCSNHVLIKKV